MRVNASALLTYPFGKGLKCNCYGTGLAILTCNVFHFVKAGAYVRVNNLNDLLAKFSTNKLTFLFSACIIPIEKLHNILSKFSTGGCYGD